MARDHFKGLLPGPPSNLQPAPPPRPPSPPSLFLQGTIDDDDDNDDDDSGGNVRPPPEELIRSIGTPASFLLRLDVDSLSPE